MGHFEAIRLEADPEGISLLDDSGNAARVVRGSIARILRQGPALILERSGDEPTVILRMGIFNAAAALAHEASGDPRADFERIVEVVRFYAGEVAVQTVPGEPPPRVIGFNPFEKPAPAPITLDTPKPAVSLAGTAQTICGSCHTALDAVPEHYVVGNLPWCARCAVPLVPGIAGSLWTAMRVALMALVASSAFSLALSYGQSRGLAAGAGLVAAVAIGVVLFGMATTTYPTQTIERRPGSPGGGRKQLPLPAGFAWLISCLRVNIPPIGIASLAAAVLMVFTLVSAPELYPEETSAFFGRELVLMSTDVKRAVPHARYGDPTSDTPTRERLIVLSRSKLKPRQALETLIAEFLFTNAFTASGSKGCAVFAEPERTAAFFVVRPCGGETCVALGRKVQREVSVGPKGSNYDAECPGSKAEFAALDGALEQPWAQ